MKHINKSMEEIKEEIHNLDQKIKDLEDDTIYKRYESWVGKSYKVLHTMGEKKRTHMYNFVYDFQVRPRLDNYKDIINNPPREVFSFVTARLIDEPFLSNFKHLCTKFDIDQATCIYLEQSSSSCLRINPKTTGLRYNLEQSKKLFNKCFDEIYTLSNKIIEIYRGQNKDSELMRDKLIGRYFKVIGNDSEYMCVHKIISADYTEDRPEYFDSLFIEFVEGRFENCRIDSNSIKRGYLIDPEEVKEISENEFLRYFNMARDQVQKLIGE